MTRNLGSVLMAGAIGLGIAAQAGAGLAAQTMIGFVRTLLGHVV